MNAPTVSIQQPMGDVVTKSFVAPQVLLVDHGLQMKVSSSTVLDLGHVMDSKIVPVQPIATSNLEAGMQSNVAVMLTSRRHQVSTMLAYNIVQSTYSPMDKITGLKTEQHTIAAYNLGSGITLQVTSGSLSAVAGNNSSNKLLWTANIHALLAKYLSGQHTAIVYELRKENANILASCMVPNILYLSFKKYVLAVFIACEQVGQSSSSGDITQGGVLISCINRMDLWSMDQEISHIYGTYSKTLSVFGVAMWDNGSDPDKYLELHYYKIPPKTSSSKSSMLTKHTTNLPVHLPRGFIKSFLLISMATDIDNNVFCAVMATSDNMLRIVSFTFDTTKDEISCKYLECYELQAGVENLVELSNLNTPRLIVSTSVGNYLLLLIVREKVKIESHLIPLTQSLIESRKSVSFFPIPNFNKESRDDVMQRVGYFFADSVDGTGVIEGKLYHSDIDISQILAPASSILTGNGHLRLRGNPLQSLPVDGSILGHCYNSHDGCLFLLSQTLPNGSNDNKARNRDQVLSIFSRCNTSYRFEFRFSLTMEEILKRYLCFDEEALAHYDKASKIVGIYQYPDSYMMGQSHNRGNGTQIFHLIFYDSWFAEDDVNEATPTEDWNFDLEHVIMNTLYIVSFAYDFQSTNTIQGLKYLTFHTFDFFDPALMHYYNNSHIKHIGDGILDSQRIAVQPITAFRSEDVPVHEENIIDDSYMCILTPEGRLCIFGWSAQITKKAANDLVEIDEIEVDVKDFTSYQRDHVTSLNTNILASCYVFSKESEDIYFYFNAHEEKYSSASTSTQHSRKEVRGEVNNIIHIHD